MKAHRCAYCSLHGFIDFTYHEGCTPHCRIELICSHSPVIQFQVSEQVRAFAEKGVSQAREGYAKFKTLRRPITRNG